MAHHELHIHGFHDAHRVRHGEPWCPPWRSIVRIFLLTLYQTAWIRTEAIPRAKS